MPNCKFKGCTIKYANFGFVSDGIKKFCAKHAETGMIDLKHKHCKCNKAQPTFGLKEDNKRICCKDCKTIEMIDLSHKNSLCPCGTRANFGLENDENPSCCIKCKTPEMKDIMNRRCIKCNKSRANFGLENDKIPLYCSKCKTSEMTDITHLKCKSELCNTQIIKYHYDGYCAFCYGNLFPDSPRIKNYKTKERLVADYIRSQYPDYDWKFDKIIENACSKRRPDIFVDLGYQIIIIEVDENQHREYEDICENKRLMEISQDVGHRPIIFIRFNPDKYINEDNKNVPSCFSIDKKTGLVKVNNKKKWNERLETLKENTDYWVKEKTTKTIELVQLFYDDD